MIGECIQRRWKKVERACKGSAMTEKCKLWKECQEEVSLELTLK